MRRIAWIDTAKGIAISLVVFGHVLGGALARNWVARADIGQFAYDYIYSFHMPLFFFISGALAADSIRSSRSRAMLSRVGSIAWPYVLWGMLFICLQPIIAPFMLFPPNTSTLESLKRLLMGEASWFLWTLFLAQCILAVVINLPMLLILVASVLSSLIPFMHDIGTFGLLLNYLPFLALGALIGQNIVDIKCSSIRLSVVIAVLSFCSLLGLVYYHFNQAPILYLLCGVVGIVGCIMVSQSIEGTVGVILGKIGEASLVVFLLHPFFQGGARALILQAVGSSSYWQLTGPTIVGIVGPTLVWLLAERFGFQWLFRLDLTARLKGRRINTEPDVSRS
jgi:fucose 4-O-acetylase-like acetyltransferase